MQSRARAASRTRRDRRRTPRPGRPDPGLWRSVRTSFQDAIPVRSVREPTADTHDRCPSSCGRAPTATRADRRDDRAAGLEIHHQSRAATRCAGRRTDVAARRPAVTRHRLDGRRAARARHHGRRFRRRLAGHAGAFAARPTIDCGLAGTVARFLVALGPLATGTVRFDGDPRRANARCGRCSTGCGNSASTSTTTGATLPADGQRQGRPCRRRSRARLVDLEPVHLGVAADRAKASREVVVRHRRRRHCHRCRTSR